MRMRDFNMLKDVNEKKACRFAAKLDLDMKLINGFINKDAEIEDDELFSIINAERG